MTCRPRIPEMRCCDRHNQPVYSTNDWATIRLARALICGPRTADELYAAAEAGDWPTYTLHRARENLDLVVWHDDSGREWWGFRWSGGTPLEVVDKR